MSVDGKRLRDSKKVVVLGVALLNLNIIFFVTAFRAAPIEIAVQMITAILFLVGIYTGVQGGIDMIQSNRIDASKLDVTNNTTITKKYEYKMDYVDKF